MPSPYTHITATEARTLCGLLASEPSTRHVPWQEWIEAYAQGPNACCPRCRAIARRSADRWKAIADVDASHALGLDGH